MNLFQILKDAISLKASDIHFKAGSPPVVRINRDLVSLQYEPLTASIIESFSAEILNSAKQQYLKTHKEIDLAYIAPDIGRFRVDIFYQRGMPGIVMRVIKEEFTDFKHLGLPDIIKDICNSTEGIVAVCGPARSGKSTTIAHMINYINASRRLHIITIEDPIEFLYEDKKCLIDQREIGIDTETFSTALRYIMREDPDLVFVGELRDRESFEAAINIAETGHLVFTTMHANNTAQAVERIMDYFPYDQRDTVRTHIADNLKAVIVQQLLQKKDTKDLVPAIEIMISNATIQKLIYENRIAKIPAAIELESNSGMQTFNQSLLKLVQSSEISEQTAFAISPNPEALKLNLQGIFLEDAKKILEG